MTEDFQQLYDRDEKLDRRVFENLGEMMGMHALLYALLITHPDKQVLAIALDGSAKAFREMINRTVMLTDEISPNVEKLVERFEGTLDKYRMTMIREELK